MNTLIGQTINTYKVIELLGQGGMAQVYRAEHTTSGEQVALKIMHPHLVSETGFLERFHREAKTIARLNHPNIIRVYDFIVAEGLSSPCIIMQLIKGPTLQQCLKEATRFGDRWSLAAVLRLAEPLAEAIDYAHSQGMIHRDIKPNNIILQPMPPTSPIPFYEKGYTLASFSSAPILTDFGMARLLDAADTRLTVTGSIAGTPTYISPEQANGGRGEAASDIYSFGVVIFEMLTGKAPFEADTPLGTMIQHMNTPPPPLRELRSDLTEAVEKTVLKALAKMPQDRYPSAVAFTQMLRQAIETGKIPPEIQGQTFSATGQFKPGHVIDSRYRVETILGAGAFSTVYKVTDLQEETVFALKVISDQAIAVEQLKQECKTLSTLRHPLIAALIDAGKLATGQYFLKLEYVAGKTLAECMATQSLSEGKKIELLEDVLEALAYMESRGIIHRDIKPSNIIVTATAAKIIDFNVSKTVDQATRTQVGSPRYMPPEVPHFGWNKTGDLFSVGMIFYELFTGRLPFMDMAGLDAWDIPNPREFAPALPEALAGVLVKAIARLPEDRFLNAAQMGEAVKRAQLQSGTQQKISAHLAPSAPAKSAGTPKALPITLSTLPGLGPSARQGLGYPLALSSGAGDLHLLTTAGLQTLTLPGLQTAKIIRRIDTPPTLGAFSADGATAVIAGIDHQLMAVTLQTGEPSGRSIQMDQPITALGCSASGQFTALCLKNRQGLLLKHPEGQIIQRRQTGAPLIAFSPAAPIVAFTDTAGMICLLDAAANTELTRLDPPAEPIAVLIFSAHGQWLVAAGKKIRWWDWAAGREAGVISGLKETVVAAAISADGLLLATADGREITLWNLAQKRKVSVIQIPAAQSLCFTGEGLAVIQSGGQVVLVNPAGGQIRANRRFDSFTCAALLPDGKIAFTGDGTGAVKVWARDGRSDPLFQWRGNVDSIRAIAVHPFKPLLAVAGTGTLWYLDLKIQSIAGQQRFDPPATGLSFSKDGRRLLMQNSDCSLVFDPADFKAKPRRLALDAAAFMPDEFPVLVGSQKGKLVWVDPASGQQQPGWPMPTAREICCNPSGSLIATATLAGEITVWRKNGKRLFDLQHVDMPVRDLFFASDDLLLGGIDALGRLNFWDSAIASRQAILPAHFGPGRIAGLSKDGKALVTAGRDGLIRWWGT